MKLLRPSSLKHTLLFRKQMSEISMWHGIRDNSAHLSCLVPCACVLWRVWLLRPHGLCPPGSSVHGASQTRILEWAAMSSSRSTGLSVLCAMWPSGAPAWYHSAQANYQYFLIKPLIQSFSIKEVQMHSHSEKQNCIRVTRNMCLHGDVAPSKGWKR